MGFWKFTRLRKQVFFTLCGLFLLSIIIFMIASSGHIYDYILDRYEIFFIVIYLITIFPLLAIMSLFYLNSDSAEILTSLLAVLGFVGHGGIYITNLGYIYISFFYIALSFILSWPANLKKDKPKN